MVCRVYIIFDIIICFNVLFSCFGTAAALRDPCCLPSAERWRMFRTDRRYAVTEGRWYFEFEVLTSGDMRVGWARPSCSPDRELGSDDLAYVFDGSTVSGERLGCFMNDSFKKQIHRSIFAT